VFRSYGLGYCRPLEAGSSPGHTAAPPHAAPQRLGGSDLRL